MRALKFTAAFAVLLGLSLAGGCAMAGRGETVTKYESGEMAHVGVAPDDATYALYGYTDSTPKFEYPLKKGDPLGFDMRNGQLMSIAGTHEDSLPPAHEYFWKKLKS